MMKAKKKLNQEWEDFKQNAPDYIFAEPMKNDLLNWRAKLLGPPDTPFEGGIFILDIIYSDEYPFKPPICIMKTNMFHPNISSTGEIYISILQNDWTPALTIRSILLTIFSILDDPVMDNPTNDKAAQCFKKNRTEYDLIVREYTLKYANESPIHDENEQDLLSTMLHTEINN
ncbi:unnamed protein product [Adineta steineri]|uniref:UBC core domain-containing protein n=1 Tax=Adineta steineri TaxID=433720 RepID=A0A813XIW1_9BILA|nr:unnamed protein product [Adineta steineri]CAF3796996.1 unnamed protein product [Adineta steineri]